MTTTRPGRPPRYAEEMKVVSYRLRPRTAAAITAACKAKNLTQAELLDRLCLRAGLYGTGDSDEIGVRGVIEPMTVPALTIVDDLPASVAHTHRKAQLNAAGWPRCACGALYIHEVWTGP